MDGRKRILVVDDDEGNRRFLEMLLGALDYECERASDGLEALERLHAGIDLVLLDVMLPRLDGFEVAKRIRGMSDFADIPIIMVTVLTSKEDRLKAVEAGANDFVSKPVDQLELKVRIASLLKMKEAQDAIKRHSAQLEHMVQERTRSLRESEERFRAIFESAPDCIFIKDETFAYTLVNPAMEALLQRPSNLIIGHRDEDLYEDLSAQHMRKVDLRVLNGETVEEENTRSVNGIPTTFLDIRTPLRSPNGEVTAICGISRNITERVQGERGSERVPESASKAFRTTLSNALLAAKSNSVTLITGESGSGKDFLAQFIHRHSERADGPYLSVNCAAIPPDLAESELFGHEPGAFTGAAHRRRGRIEIAEGGTLLLNEIGELPLNLQAKLHSFLDTMSFTRVGGEKTIHADIRLLAATNRRLKEEVSVGRFREDLYYRLNVFLIEVPPLRERIEDIPKIVEELAQTLAADMQLRRIPTIHPGALETLSLYDWPGNVRELRNILERAFILSRGRTVMSKHIQLRGTQTIHNREPVSPLAGKSLPEYLAEAERRAIEEALTKSGGSKGDAAKALGVSRFTLSRHMRKLGLDEQ